jgi:hypothetical protein
MSHSSGVIFLSTLMCTFLETNSDFNRGANCVLLLVVAVHLLPFQLAGLVTGVDKHFVSSLQNKAQCGAQADCRCHQAPESW